MNSTNSNELIEAVLKLRRAANAGMRDTQGLTDAKIASIINITHGTHHHTKDSIRAIYRRHSEKQKTPSFDMSKITKWKENVPLSLDGNYMIIGDTHLPFVEPGYFDFLYRTYTKYNIQHVLHGGDVVDEYSLSFFDKAPEADSPEVELQKAKKGVSILAEMFPKMWLVKGNHDNRYLRLAIKAGIPEIRMRTLEEVLETPPGWVWNESYIINNDTFFDHGTNSGTGMNATWQKAWAISMNVIGAHTHSYGGVEYRNCGMKTRWALNVGCGLDMYSYGAKYARAFKYKVTLGCGVVVNDGIPGFEPFRK